MSWDGYFTYAGQEFINAQRTEAYAKAAGAMWLKGCFGGTDLGPMLGERYRSPILDPAPWTDPDVPESYGFFGVYPLGVSGLEDSTRVGNVVESTRDGGTVNRIRHGTRAVVFNLAIVADSDCAADYGARWLRRLTLGAACSTQVTEACAGEDLCYLSCEPTLDWTGTDSSEGTSPINPVPVDAPTISLATVIAPTDIAAATALNQNLDSNPGLIAPFMKWLDRVHSENHTTSGVYNIWSGAKNKGTSPTSLGAKMTTAGLKTSVYGHGSYVMQARPEESPDLETHYPLAASIFFPGWPDEERDPDLLTVDPDTGRDERNFEGTTANFWAARGPAGAVSQLVNATTPGLGTNPRSGVQCLAVTMGATPGQMTASTGITTGIAKPCFQGMKVDAGLWVKPRTTVRAANAEIRWMNAAYSTVATTAGPVSTEVGDTWTERTVSGEAPATAVWWALQVRWAGPPANTEVHYIDTAYTKDYASRLPTGITGSQTSITVRSAQRFRPTDSIASVDATANTLTHTAHGLAANTVVYMVGTNLPSPLNETTAYFVVNPTANTFQLSLTSGGAAIDLASIGAQSKYTKAPPNWPFRAPRAGDITPVTTSTNSVTTARCVHWIRIDDEIMGLTAVSTPALGIVTLTVVRGMWGTSPTVHDADAKVYSPVYVGSISEGADATFAGSPQVNDATKALRYSLALEQGLSQPRIKRATEWVAKRRIMEMLEYDWVANPVVAPDTTDPTTNPPNGWSGYVSAGSDIKSVNSLYLDITGTSFYNMADSYGYDVVPWSIIGVPNSIPPLPPESMQTQAALAEAQINKINDLRTYMSSVGIPGPQHIVGNNLSWQANVQDPYKQRIIDSGVLDLSNLEFWLNDPTAVLKYEAQRTQWMLCCKNNLRVCVWPKTGQNGVANTPFDSAPVGTASAADVAHYRRWCYAHFLLGWRGSDRQQLVTEWGLGFEATMEPEFQYELGNPLGEFDVWEDLPEHAPGVKYRDYEQGRVYLNTTGAPYPLELEVLMKDLSTPGLDEVITKTIGAYDAAFLHAIPTAGGPAPEESTLLDILGCLDPYERSLRRVVFNTGPTITAKRTTTDGGAVWTATMTAVAGNPWEFSTEKPIVENFTGQQAAYVCDPPGHVATFNRVVDDTSCMPTAYFPVFDPSCPAFVPPPTPPTVPLGCYSPPANWLRRQFTIPKEFIPLWGEVVPKIEIRANGKNAAGQLVSVRNLRLRFYADVDDNGLVTPPSEDVPGENCAYCGDIVVSYVPAGQTLVLDGSDEIVYVEAPGVGRRRADSLVFATDGTPFQWPVLSCGFAYIVAVDTEQTAALPSINLSLYARVA